MLSVMRLRQTNDIMFFGGRHLKEFSQNHRVPPRVSLGKSLAIICVLGLATVTSTASGPGYLRTVGPAPLRFWSPPPRKPEPAATNAAPASASSPASAPNPYDFMNAFGAQPPLVMEATSTSGPSPMAPVASDQPAPTNGNQNGSSTNPQSGDVVSPQMLLQYFPNGNKNGRGNQNSIYVPVDANAVINQSQQTPSRPSSATYSN
jgi:hypothetical protein